MYDPVKQAAKEKKLLALFDQNSKSDPTKNNDNKKSKKRKKNKNKRKQKEKKKKKDEDEEASDSTSKVNILFLSCGYFFSSCEMGSILINVIHNFGVAAN